MNSAVTSKEQIITVCQKLIREKGFQAVGMRSVAAECGVAVGSIYNYFPSKSELLCAATESIWKDIFHMSPDNASFSDFNGCLSWLLGSIQKGSRRYPEFFSKHAVIFASEDKAAGQKMMEKYFQHLKSSLLAVLKRDTNIREDAFNEILTPELFVNYIFELFLSSVMNPGQDCRGILEIAQRCLY